MKSHLADKIDALLPQTQCGECHYTGCRPYAEAMAAGDDSPNHCPPGGVSTLNALGKLLNIDVSVYQAEVAATTREPSIAVINEDHCIGCTKCIAACPVDAIIGAAKHMHTILSQECTGCGLCVEPCPVDCIQMEPIEALTFDKDKSRQRFNQKNKRLQQSDINTNIPEKKIKQQYILEAIKRSKQKRTPG